MHLPPPIEHLGAITSIIPSLKRISTCQNYSIINPHNMMNELLRIMKKNHVKPRQCISSDTSLKFIYATFSHISPNCTLLRGKQIYENIHFLRIHKSWNISPAFSNIHIHYWLYSNTSRCCENCRGILNNCYLIELRYIWPPSHSL